MNKNFLFIYSLILYIFWIFINNLLLDLKTSLLVLLLLVVLFLLFIFFRPKYYLLIITLIPFLLWVIISNHNIDKINENISNIKPLNVKVEIELIILDIRKIDNENIIYKSQILKINDNTIKNTIEWETIISSKDKIEKWTIIKTNSKLYLYKNTNGFNYKNYMLSNWLYFKNYPFNYKVIGKEKIIPLEVKIISLRSELLNTISHIYTEDEWIFLWWILLWARENLPKELKNNFNNSWLTHFIAVSWFNITILIVFLSYFIKFLPSSFKVIIMSIFIILFTFLVWFTAPVVRASITGILWYIILTSWRKTNNLSIILFTLAIMVSYSPYSLNYDISLHLSFLAVIWILYCQKFYENIFSFVTNILEIRTALTLTMSALTLTLPIMMFNFWQLSIVSPLANILVSWTIPFAMLLWFMSIIVYYISPLFWFIIWYLTWILLKWDILIVNLLGESKYSIVKYNFWEYSWYFEIIYLITLFFIIIYFRQNKKK